MNEALSYLYYIFDKFVNFVFNEAYIAPTVSIGWIAVSVIVFSMLISSILNLPHSIGKFSSTMPTESISIYGKATSVSGGHNMYISRTYKRRMR